MGYGDVVPVTIVGRIVAFGCTSFGIILNGMPISFLFNKFSDYYAKLKAEEYNTKSVERRLQLKRRLRRRMDMCFHHSEEDNSTDSHCDCPHWVKLQMIIYVGVLRGNMLLCKHETNMSDNVLGTDKMISQ